MREITFYKIYEILDKNNPNILNTINNIFYSKKEEIENIRDYVYEEVVLDDIHFGRIKDPSTIECFSDYKMYMYYKAIFNKKIKNNNNFILYFKVIGIELSKIIKEDYIASYDDIKFKVKRKK